MRYTFLVNPASGGGAAPEAVLPVAQLLRAAGAEVEVTYSPGPRAIDHLVSQAIARGDVVVSVGGDGMVSSLVGEVSRQGGMLGLVPAGRGNDFARTLGIPADPQGQAEVLLSGEPRAVDLLSWTSPGSPERIVAGSVYAGVDARAAQSVDRLRRVPRPLQYPLAAVHALATYTPARYRVSVDDVVVEAEAATVVVANSGYYGKGMHIAPGAVVDDGMLDVIVVAAASRRALITALPKLYDGSHVDLPEVRVVRGRRVDIAADSRRVVSVGGDGEPLGLLPRLADPPAVVRVLPSALRVLAPR